MSTHVYIDGFNLYYRAVKSTPYKWLDVLKLVRQYFHRHQIDQIRYFTARVQETPTDPQKPMRQLVYLRALETLPGMSIHYGRFVTRKKRRPLAVPPNTHVEVIEKQEKGSDVNLATYLLFDAYHDEYDFAIVVSNDSDLVEPIRLVQQDKGVKVAVLNPEGNKKLASRDLRNVAAEYRIIKTGAAALRASQFSLVLSDANGKFRKPTAW